MNSPCPCPPPNLPIVLRWGDTRILTATVSLNSLPVDLTGSTIVLTVSCQELWIREQFTSAGSDAPVTIDVATSSASCTISTSSFPNVRARYRFSWILTDEAENVTTLEESSFEVLPSL